MEEGVEWNGERMGGVSLKKKDFIDVRRGDLTEISNYYNFLLSKLLT